MNNEINDKINDALYNFYIEADKDTVYDLLKDDIQNLDEYNKKKKQIIFLAKAKVNEANTLLATVLSKSEAIKAMRDGKKVTHQYFKPDEWVQLTPSGLYQFEDGVMCTSLLFWQDRKGEQWETGWSLYGG